MLMTFIILRVKQIRDNLIIHKQLCGKKKPGWQSFNYGLLTLNLT